MHAERDIGLPILSVSLSVCLTNAGTVSERMDMSSNIWRSGRSSILVFFYPIAIIKFQGNHLSCGVKYKGAGKMLQISPFIAETVGL